MTMAWFKKSDDGEIDMMNSDLWRPSDRARTRADAARAA